LYKELKNFKDDFKLICKIGEKLEKKISRHKKEIKERTGQKRKARIFWSEADYMRDVVVDRYIQ